MGLKDFQHDLVTWKHDPIVCPYPVHWPTEYTRETAVEARDAAEKIARMVRKDWDCDGGLGKTGLFGFGK